MDCSRRAVVIGKLMTELDLDDPSVLFVIAQNDLKQTCGDLTTKTHFKQEELDAFVGFVWSVLSVRRTVCTASFDETTKRRRVRKPYDRKA